MDSMLHYLLFADTVSWSKLHEIAVVFTARQEVIGMLAHQGQYFASTEYPLILVVESILLPEASGSPSPTRVVVLMDYSCC